MKNLFKYLGVFALAGALGLQTMTVSAEEETCPEGQTAHTNYYMFLEINPRSYYQTNLGSLGDGAFFSHFTSADKSNNIANGKILSQGNVPITNGTKNTYPDSDKIPAWTVAEFWQKFYTAATKANADTLVYDEGDTAYLLHGYWYSCSDNTFSGCTKRTHADNGQGDALSNYLKTNYSSIGSTTLATAGTSLPNTKITSPSDMSTIIDTTMRFTVERNFSKSDLLAGADVGNGSQVIYSPAAYMVKYCKKSGSGSKTVTYDPNTPEKVTNMPSNQTFTDECVNLDSKTPVRDGYDFVGWATNGAASTADHQPGDEYCGDSVTLMAIWKKKGEPSTTDFTVTYKANGGKNEPAAQSAKAGGEIIITSSRPTLTNNNFLGWSRDPEAKEPDPKYKAGSSYRGEEGSITLYAVWQTQTGISAHLIAFGAVALVAGGALLVAKKKELFRQI